DGGAGLRDVAARAFDHTRGRSGRVGQQRRRQVQRPHLLVLPRSGDLLGAGDELQRGFGETFRVHGDDDRNLSVVMSSFLHLDPESWPATVPDKVRCGPPTGTRPGHQDPGASRSAGIGGSGRTYSAAPLNSDTSVPSDVLASPKSMRVLGLKNSGFSTPEKPGFMERFRTKQVRAWSTLMIGMP